MATIRRLPSSEHNVQVRREGQPPLSATLGTATEAKAWARKVESDIDTGKHFGYSCVRKVSDAIEHFKASSATINTIDDRHLAWWREALGNRQLFHFTADVVELGRERLAAENIESNRKKRTRRRSPQTIRH